MLRSRRSALFGRGLPIAALAAAVSALSGCVGTPVHKDLFEAAPAFSPAQFFSGETIGEGTLKIVFKGTRHTHVVGHGSVEAGNVIVLTQKVAEGDKPVRTRTWRIRPAGANRFTGTLSDAEGPIVASTAGNSMDIRYKMKGGLNVEQWLYLQSGEKTVINRMVVKKFGIPVASLRETIVKQ